MWHWLRDWLPLTLPGQRRARGHCSSSSSCMKQAAPRGAVPRSSDFFYVYWPCILYVHVGTAPRGPRSRTAAGRPGQPGRPARTDPNTAAPHDQMPELGDLDAHLLRRILLRGTTHDDLLRWLALCAKVCRDWRHIALQSVAYGSELPRTRVSAPASGLPEDDDRYRSCYNYTNADDEHTRVLKSVSECLRRAREGCMTYRYDESTSTNVPAGITMGLIAHPGELFGGHLGEQGCRILGTAMQSLPSPLKIQTLSLSEIGLTPEGVRPIVAAMRLGFAGNGLKALRVANNRDLDPQRCLGDEGVAMVAAALPPTLQELLLNGTECGSRGLVAVAAVLPTLRSLKKLTLDDNWGVYTSEDNEERRDCAWVTLAAALPLLPALHELSASCVMNDVRVMALAAVLPRCSATFVQLRLAPLPGFDLGEPACSALRAAWGTRPSEGLDFNGGVIDSDEGGDDY